ncbi:hypothetical protein [Prescottella agglutinans]|uniref:Uncharacterized protein n=1 Tax=Prescottella agglutinans TaxID=1644129 RepID=A0ABT6MJR3_9NOCA|nr:hypothetical protein [Prescottella agglutinans]MDH6284552.1 hypothetical protein [Prescottella agglutinans]
MREFFHWWARKTIYALLETFDELSEMGHRDLLADAVSVINGVSESSSVDIDKIHGELKRRTRAVRRIPHDPYLAAGAAFDFAELQPATKVAYAEMWRLSTSALRRGSRRSLRRLTGHRNGGPRGPRRIT